MELEDIGEKRTCRVAWQMDRVWGEEDEGCNRMTCPEEEEEEGAAN